MAGLISVENVYLVLALIVPGLIASSVRAQFITGRKPTHTEAALSYLTLSIIYYAFTFPAVEYALSLHEPGYKKAFVWFVLVFVGPALFGLLLGLNVQKGLTRRLLQRMGLNPVHVMPSAWDWKFGALRESWVLAVLKDGTKFAGYCGVDSFMSSDPKERDIYIQKVFDVDPENKWHPRDSSVLIAAGEIQTIEFWPVLKEAKNAQLHPHPLARSITPERLESKGIPATAVSGSRETARGSSARDGSGGAREPS